MIFLKHDVLNALPKKKISPAFLCKLSYDMFCLGGIHIFLRILPNAMIEDRGLKEWVTSEWRVMKWVCLGLPEPNIYIFLNAFCVWCQSDD